MKPTKRIRLQGIHPQTAYRWFQEGTLPAPAGKRGRCGKAGRRPDVPARPGMVLVCACSVAGFYGGYTYRIAVAGERASIDWGAALVRAAFWNAAGEPGS